MGNYALLALDMDGTLLNDDHGVNDSSAHAIQDALDAGITVILSTGRAYKNAFPYAEELGLKGPLVTVNGSEIWKNPNEMHIRYLLDREKVHKMYQLSKKYDTWFWAYSTITMYNRDRWNVDIDQEEWLKFGFNTQNDSIRGKLYEELLEIGGLELSNSSPHNIEINPQGINKATGVGTVCELLGIQMNQVVAVGDSLNDMAVIRAAGLGVAMGNAQDAVKAAADAVVASNNEDGIAEVIRRFML